MLTCILYVENNLANNVINLRNFHSIWHFSANHHFLPHNIAKNFPFSPFQGLSYTLQNQRYENSKLSVAKSSIKSANRHFLPHNIAKNFPFFSIFPPPYRLAWFYYLPNANVSVTNQKCAVGCKGLLLILKTLALPTTLLRHLLMLPTTLLRGPFQIEMPLNSLILHYFSD